MWCTRCLRAGAPNVQTRRDSLFQSQHFYGNNIIAKLSTNPAYPISLKQMMAFGKDMTEERLLQSGNFVRQELPIRIAHRIRDLQNLPFVVGLNPNLERVYISYLDAFEGFRKFPHIKSMQDNDRFCDFLKNRLESHWATIPKMMTGLIESSPHLPPAARERFLTRMLRSRIARRVLAEQHVALTNQFHDAVELGPTEDSQRLIGVIDTSLSPYQSIMDLEKVLPLVTGVQTEIVIDGQNAETIRFSYINDHIQFIVFELIKNAVLASVEKGRPNAGRRIAVTMSETKQHIGIRVTDEAGGIASSYQPTTYSKDDRPLVSASRSGMLHFGHPRQSTFLNAFRNTPRLGATVQEQISQDADERLGTPGQRQSFGLSLPLCKVYAEYFGGHLDLFTLDGYGSDAYLTIPKQGTQKAVI